MIEMKRYYKFYESDIKEKIAGVGLSRGTRYTRVPVFEFVTTI
jgi:hypothetical protein